MHIDRGGASHGRAQLLVALVALVVAVVAVVLIAGHGGSDHGNAGAGAAAARNAPAPRPRHGRSAAASGRTSSTRPNIVFVLTDDLSLELLPYMPHVQELERDGLTFDNYFVSDSLCCPSRASIFTGNFPHDTGVLTNVGPDGGFGVFHDRGEEQNTFATALQHSGYVTALMGKYLNRYMQDPNVPATYVPPGYDTWDVAGYAYGEFDYTLNQNGTLRYYGEAPSDYLTNVIARKGVQFIDQAAGSGKPFMLELSTFAPHSPYTPDYRDRRDFPGLTAPRPPSFDTLPTGAPQWLAVHPPLSGNQIRRIDHVFRRRAQAVQAVDRMLGRVEQTLQADGIAGNTFTVFSSDNGLHEGEYRLMPGKLTAFDTDIHVPLVVDGPGITAGSHTAAMAENIDLAPTFAEIAGAPLRSDGTSLVPLFSDQRPTAWQNAILVEHQGARGGDGPDSQSNVSGNPPTYEALRTQTFLYVVYATGEREYYDLADDPDELQNLAGELTPDQLSSLDAALAQLQGCHDEPDCQTAMHLGPLPPGLPTATPGP